MYIPLEMIPRWLSNQSCSFKIKRMFFIYIFRVSRQI
jgi:hypothetical protein